MEKTDAVWCIHQWEWLSDCDVSTAVTQGLLWPSSHTPCSGKNGLSAPCTEQRCCPSDEGPWVQVSVSTIKASFRVLLKTTLTLKLQQQQQQQQEGCSVANSALWSPSEGQRISIQRSNFKYGILHFFVTADASMVRHHRMTCNARYEMGAFVGQQDASSFLSPSLGCSWTVYAVWHSCIVLLGDQCQLGARLTWACVSANGLCQSAFTWMSGSGVSKQNITLWCNTWHTLTVNGFSVVSYQCIEIKQFLVIAPL